MYFCLLLVESKCNTMREREMREKEMREREIREIEEERDGRDMRDRRDERDGRDELYNCFFSPFVLLYTINIYSY